MLYTKNGKIIVCNGKPANSNQCPCIQPPEPEETETQVYVHVIDVSKKRIDMSKIEHAIQDEERMDLLTNAEYPLCEDILYTNYFYPSYTSLTYNNNGKLSLTIPMTITTNNNVSTCNGSIKKITDTLFTTPLTNVSTVDDIYNNSEYSYYTNTLCGNFTLNTTLTNGGDVIVETDLFDSNNDYSLNFLPYKFNYNNTSFSISFNPNLAEGSLLTAIFLSNTNDEIDNMTLSPFRTTLAKKLEVYSNHSVFSNRYFNITPEKIWVEKDYFFDRIISGETSGLAWISGYLYGMDLSSKLIPNYSSLCSYLFHGCGQLYTNSQTHENYFLFLYKNNTLYPVTNDNGYRYFNGYTTLDLPYAEQSNLKTAIVSTFNINGYTLSGFTIDNTYYFQLVPNRPYYVYNTLAMSINHAYWENEYYVAYQIAWVDYPNELAYYNDEYALDENDNYILDEFGVLTHVTSTATLFSSYFLVTTNGEIYKLDRSVDGWVATSIEDSSITFNIPHNNNTPLPWYYIEPDNSYNIPNSNISGLICNTFSSFYFYYEPDGNEPSTFLINKNYFDTKYGYLILPQKIINLDYPGNSQIETKISTAYYNDLEKVVCLKENYSVYIGDYTCSHGINGAEMNDKTYSDDSKFAFDNSTQTFSNSLYLSSIPLSLTKYFYFQGTGTGGSISRNTIQYPFMIYDHLNGNVAGTAAWDGQDILEIVKLYYDSSSNPNNYTGVKCEILTCLYVISSTNADIDYHLPGWRSFGTITGNLQFNQYYKFGYSFYNLSAYNHLPTFVNMMGRTFDNSTTLAQLGTSLKYNSYVTPAITYDTGFRSLVIIRPIQLLQGTITDSVCDRFRFLSANTTTGDSTLYSLKTGDTYSQNNFYFHF